MTIAHLIAPISFGGGESLLLNLTRERSQGVDEIVISIFHSEIFNQYLDADRITHYELQKKALGHGISKISMLFRTPLLLLLLPKLILILWRRNVNVLHVHGYPAVLMGAVVNCILGIRSIYTHHFYRSKPFYLERLILGLCYKTYATCTGVSNLVTESMKKAFPMISSRLVTVHNCVGINFFHTQHDPAYQYLRTSKRTLFVQIARFSSFKNQLLVVESLGKLSAEERAQVCVVFAGEGVEKPNVMKRACELGLVEEVRFLGFVMNENLPGLLACADFGLFPSENEGFGIGAAECLAAGLPVLALDTELMREVVGDGGLLLSKEKFHHGFKSIMKIGNSLSEKAKQQATQFRPDKIKKEYLKIYQS